MNDISSAPESISTTVGQFDLEAHERSRVLGLAAKWRDAPPITVTAARAERSEGGLHDYFSEGDYWWPDPDNPAGPYIRRDGRTNPEIFTDHREALRRFAIIVTALTAAWKLTGDKEYSEAAHRHLDAWFVDEATRMTPHLKYGQAICGLMSGRGIGLVDTTHLAEVAVAVHWLNSASALHDSASTIVRWFHDFAEWMTTSQMGIDERDHGNNHTTCWVLQVACFALLTRNETLLADCRERFKQVLLRQMDAEGRYPLELERTKPFNYTVFNLDLMTATCQVLSQTGESLWEYALADGRSIKAPIAFMHPFLHDKSAWPYAPDVEYFEEYPVRQSALLFGALAFRRDDWLATWKKLDADPTVEEIIRNFPIRQPVLWFGLS